MEKTTNWKSEKSNIIMKNLYIYSEMFDGLNILLA